MTDCSVYGGWWKRRFVGAASSIGLAAIGMPAMAAPQGPDLLSFAHGAIPVRIEADPTSRVTLEHAILAIDGSDAVRAVSGAVPPNTKLAFVYALPAPTVFERLAVPSVRETPSPRQTFIREVAVYGSATSATEGFVKLASATLSAHERPGLQTELVLHRRDAVRWVRLELAHGLDTPGPQVWLEFSEIIGQGRQDEAPLDTGFGGQWKGRGLALVLDQAGAVVAGCYDRQGKLEGSVVGRVLHATGREPGTGVASSFIASLGEKGTLQMLRSTNGAPFKHYVGERGAPKPLPACNAPTAPRLACDSVIHGIQFDFDSATLRPSSAAVLDSLHQGLAAARIARVVIEGHTSSEGEEAYNRSLSQRRARAVVDELVRRGLAADRLTASGAGESRPIAPNDDEAGRSLNRRVEVRCQT
jgi:OOP family OmpA-OmpF porin